MSKKNPWQDSNPRDEELVDMYVMADRYVPRFALGLQRTINAAAIVYGAIVRDSLDQYYSAYAAFAGLASDPRRLDAWAPLTAVVESTITEIVTESTGLELNRLRLIIKQAPAEVLEYAATRSADLVTAIGEGQRNALRTIITDGVAAGKAPRVVAKQIKTLGIGLAEKGPHTYSRLARYRQAQIDAGVRPALVERRTAKFCEKLLKDRAESIARTEMIAAQNIGVLDAWNTGVRTGLVMPTAVKEWIAGVARTCSICVDLDGERVPLNETFSIGTMSPPAHPQCRCTMGLVTV